MVADHLDERHGFDPLEQEQDCLNLAGLCEECSQVSAAQDQVHSNLGSQLAALVCTLCQLESLNHCSETPRHGRLVQTLEE